MSYLERDIYEEVVDLCEEIENEVVTGDVMILFALEKIIQRVSNKAKAMPLLSLDGEKTATIRVTSVSLDKITNEKKVDFEIRSDAGTYKIKIRGAEEKKLILTK
jgi:hypothetical protein